MKSPQKFQGQLHPDDQMVFRNPSLPGILLLFLISHFFTKQPLFSWRPSEIQVGKLRSKRTLDFGTATTSYEVSGKVAICTPFAHDGLIGTCCPGVIINSLSPHCPKCPHLDNFSGSLGDGLWRQREPTINW